MTMKVFLIGYGRMAAKLALGVLQSGHELVGVFRADRLRHNFLDASIRDFFSNDDFYAIIKKYKIKEVNTNSVNNKRFISKIKKLEADVILVGSCGEKFGKEILKAPNVACVNVHPSLLPKYRGANPYFHTIKNGEKSSGVTFHLMNEKNRQRRYFDAGGCSDIGCRYGADSEDKDNSSGVCYGRRAA